MPYTPRKDELQAMADAIRDCQSLEDVAKTALKTAFALIQNRNMVGVAIENSRLIYGPFASETDAYNALAGNKLEGFEDEEGIKAKRKQKIIPSLGGKALVFTMVGPQVQADRVEQYDWRAKCAAEHLCINCGHGVLKHDVQGKPVGCSLPGCDCAKVKKKY